jgi:poly-gamma-glutamate capsule biosynthesis protein CapA/YwtB (metallophosphatase superfamily)
MVYVGDPISHQPSLVEMARRGNLQAVSYWLNSLLAPYRLYARVTLARSGYLRIQVEMQPTASRDATEPAFRQRLVRYICHQLWKLNSPTLDGASIVACYVGQPKTLWKQSVRIVSPARRAYIANTPQAVQKRLKFASRQRQQFQALRSVLISGTSVAAFVLGCWLGYADAPSDQTQASAVIAQLNRGETKVQAALETIPVLKPAATNGDPAVNLMFGGDIAFGENYDTRVGNNNGWSLTNMETLRQADISMVNLDTPLTAANQALPGKKANVKAAPDRVNVLVSGGVDVVNLANDASMDYQATGLSDTLATLGKAGIPSVGAGRNSTEARRPVIMEVKGQRVAYLGYYDSDLHAATDRQAGTNPRRNDRIAADIKAIRDQVDWVVVNYHWGEELAKYPGDWQIDLARFTIDQGADMVVGHHAKVLQGAEVYRGRPIIYSLGNFIFGGKSTDQNASDYDTAVLKVALNDKQMKVEFVPVEVRNFKAQAMSGAKGEQILNQITNVSDIFEEPMTGPMVLDLRTNTVTKIQPAPKASPASEPSSTTEPAAAPAESQSPDAAAESDATDKSDTTEKDEAWNQDSFTAPTPGPQGNATTDNGATPAVKVKSKPEKSTEPDSLQPMKRRFAQAVAKRTAAAKAFLP